MASSLLRVLPGDQVSRDANDPGPIDLLEGSETAVEDLAAYIRDQFETMKRFRESSGIDARLLRALRMFNGEYDPDQLAAIRQMGGSEVFARLVSTKARGATALLRDIYFSEDRRPWGLKPTPEPALPEDIAESVRSLAMVEAQAAVASGASADVGTQVPERIRELESMARETARQTAAREAAEAEARLDDILTEGGFYTALADILVDVTLFPFVVMKGPVVRRARDLAYENGVPVMSERPRMFWKRVSPFDLYYRPGVSSIADTDVCERLRWTRRDLNNLIDVPTWDQDAVRSALRDYETGLLDTMSGTDSQRAVQEDDASPGSPESQTIYALEFHGNVPGRLLREHGFSADDVPDEDRDYFVEAWVVGRYVLKAQLHPSPRQRHPYFVTSFEKVPGTVMGNSLPDMLSDIQDVANATLRALVNNMALASGPQVVVDLDRVSEMDDPSSIYPWKRWMVVSNFANMGHPGAPVTFEQPRSNAAELLGVYRQMVDMADEVSAIPKYITGSGAPGGAGRTASGLSMLMGNAAKIIKQVAHNIDNDIVGETIRALYDIVMVADAGVNLRGDEKIVVYGVSAVAARETERVRQLEFLNITANPLDFEIVGMRGRARILRALATSLGLDSEGSPVPTDEELVEREKQKAEAARMAQMAAQAQGDGAPAPGASEGPELNLVQPSPVAMQE